MGRALCAVAAIVVVLGGAAANGQPDRPLLAFLRGATSDTLVRVDRSSLYVVGSERIDVGSHSFAWSFSRDRSRLALGGDGGGRYVPEVLLVDTRRLRTLGRVVLAPRGWVVATTWLPGQRLRAVLTTEDVTLVTVDAARRRVVERRNLDGQLLHVTHARDSLVVLLAPTRVVGLARLAVIRPSGRVDVAVLGRVPIALKGDATTTPGLAVDVAGNRAFVVTAGGEVAEVRLPRLQVTYHRLSQRTSQARAKRIEGPVRHARWLGNGLLAVSGADYSVSGDQLIFTPAGVRIVDTRDWSARSIAPGADGFVPAGDVLFAISETWSSELRQPTPVGVAAYELDGRKRFHLYEGTRAWVVYADGRRAYVDPMGPGAVDVVDLATGEVVERRNSVPVPLAGEASSGLP
jgi:hypothetical protein